MADTIDPSARTAAAPTAPGGGSVTLINSFVVPAGRDEAFRAQWELTSKFMRAQPGFESLRLHRAVAPEAHYRYVNVAVWSSARDFGAAHATDEFRALVADPAWREFPSSPALYEVVAE
jgi:heme-degrading monooxygenase HmoA